MARTEIRRASEVVNVLVKQGLGYFVQEYGLKWHLPFYKKFKVYKKEEDVPARIRLAMEELGGAYVKLGQLLSLRPDLVPQEYCNEFRKLLDNVPAISYEHVKKIIEQELKVPIDVLFKEFDKNPIGSASIAQVHAAKLKNGKKVVVKIQRPNIREQIEADIKIMHYFAYKAEKYLKNAVTPVDIVSEFERYTRNELNFLTEAKNIEIFHKMFKGSKRIIVPEVYFQYTTGNVLVMDYLQGIKLSELQVNLSKNIKQEIVSNIADAAFKQIVEEGIFHADLHPGNIIIMPGRAIGLLDFGIVGALDKELKHQAMDMIVALVNRDAKDVVRTLLKVGTPTSETNLEDFATEIETTLYKWHGAELNEARITRMLHEMFNSCAKHHIRMPADLILLGKAMVTMEATCAILDPEFNFVDYTKPQIARVLKREKRPAAIIKRFMEKSKNITETLYDLPQKTLELIEKFKREPIKLDLDDVDVWHLGRDINHSSNRLSYAIVIAALLLTGATLINIFPQFKGYSIISIAAFLAAFFMTVMLTGSIMRETSLAYGPRKKLER